MSERATPDQNETIDVELLVEEHKALLSLKILDDRMMDVVKAAKPIGDGFMLMTGDRTDLDELAGWVAGECNHETKRRRARLLNDACEAIETALR